MDELADGIHRWTAPHPEWRPKAEEVAVLRPGGG